MALLRTGAGPEEVGVELLSNGEGMRYALFSQSCISYIYKPVDPLSKSFEFCLRAKDRIVYFSLWKTCQRPWPVTPLLQIT